MQSTRCDEQGVGLAAALCMFMHAWVMCVRARHVPFVGHLSSPRHAHSPLKQYGSAATRAEAQERELAHPRAAATGVRHGTCGMRRTTFRMSIAEGTPV